MNPPNTASADRHLSTLELHQFRMGELEPKAFARARVHLLGCEACAERLRHQERMRAEFVLRPMPEALRPPTPSPSLWGRWLAPVALSTAAVLAVLYVSQPEAGVTRIRGVAAPMEVWVATADGPRLLSEADRLGDGDRVAIKYDADGASHVGFAGRDGNGLVEVWGVYEVPGDGLVNAPFGLELDDAPGNQELFVVTGDADLDADRVKEAIDRGGSWFDGVRVERAVVPKRENSTR